MKFTTGRSKAQAISDAEWKITAQLEIAGVPIGTAIPMRYSDTQVAGDPSGVGQLVGARLDEAALAIKRAGLVPKRKRQPAKKNQEHA